MVNQSIDTSSNASNSSNGLLHGVWQLPFVNVFKTCNTFDFKNCAFMGDVKVVNDKLIKKRVVRIRGLISAANYLSVQHNSTLGLGLTGEYVLLQMRGGSNNLQTFHVDVNTNGSFGIRFSFSNLFKEPKATGHIIQLPLEFKDNKWSYVCLHIPSLITQYFPDITYASIKGFKLCSNLFVRNIFTSNKLLYPGRYLPRDIAMPVLRDEDWAQRYNWMQFCGDDFQMFDTVQGDENCGDSDAPLTLISSKEEREEAIRLASKVTATKRRVNSHPRRKKATPRRSALQALSEAHDLPREDDFEDLSINLNKGDSGMELGKVIGYTPQMVHTELLWSPDGNHVVFGSNSTVVVMDVRDNKQTFLLGHTGKVSVLCFSQNGLLASAQDGYNPIIRIWDLSTFGQNEELSSTVIPCLAVLRVHHHGIVSLTFSKRAELLTAVGRDHHDRFLLVVWNVTEIFNQGQAVVVARQISEFNVRKLVFSPYDNDPYGMISCGSRSIRFWRLSNRHIPASSLALEKYSKNIFTDIAFEAKYGEADVTKKRMFVSCMNGAVFQVNYEDRTLECIYQLHDGPIYSLSVNEGFCVTASEDRYLRVWPLDFSDYYLQAQHKDGVVSVDISSDGLKVAVGTNNGSIGILDLASTAYKTILRSHTDTIHALSVDPHPNRREFATVSKDGTVRVWSADTLQQIYEFYIPNDEALCISYHPSHNDYKLAVGFVSGSVRILDVTTTSLFVDYQQHECDVYDIVFSPEGNLLFSNSLDGNICVYDVVQNYQPLRMFTCYRSSIGGDMNSFNPSIKPVKSPYKDSKRRITGALDRSNILNTSQHGGSDVKMNITNNSSILSDSNEANPTSTTIVVKSSKFSKHLGRENIAESNPEHCLVVNEDGSYLATISSDSSIVILVETNELKEVKRFNTMSAPVSRLLFPKGKEELLMILINGTVQRYNIESGRLIDEFKLDSLPESCVSTAESRKKTIKNGQTFDQKVICTAAAMHSGSGLLAVADSAGLIQICSPYDDINKTNIKPNNIFMQTGIRKIQTQKYAGHYTKGTSTIISEMCFVGSKLISVCGDSIFIWNLLSEMENEIDGRIQGGHIATPEKMLKEPNMFSDDIQDDDLSEPHDINFLTSEGKEDDNDNDEAKEGNDDVKEVISQVEEIKRRAENNTAHKEMLAALKLRQQLSEKLKKSEASFAFMKTDSNTQITDGDDTNSDEKKAQIPFKCCIPYRVSPSLPIQDSDAKDIKGTLSVLGSMFENVGFSGEQGRSNVVWHQESGMIVYSHEYYLVVDLITSEEDRFYLKGSTLSVVCTVTMSEDGTKVAAGTEDGTIDVFDVIKGSLICSFPSNNHAAIQSLCFVSTTELVAVTTTIAALNKTVMQVYDIQNKQIIARRDLLGDLFEIKRLPKIEAKVEEFDANIFHKQNFVTVGDTLSIWSLKKTKQHSLDTYALQSQVFHVQEPRIEDDHKEDTSEHSQSVCVAIISDNIATRGLATGTVKGFIRLYDSSGNLLLNYKACNTEISNIYFTWANQKTLGSDSAYIICSGSDGIVYNYFVPHMNALGHIRHDGIVPSNIIRKVHETVLDGGVSSLQVAVSSLDQIIVVAATISNTIWTCPLIPDKIIPATRLVSSPVTSKDSVITASAFHSKDALMGTVTNDGILKLWKMISSKDVSLVMMFQVEHESCASIAFPKQSHRNECVVGYESGIVRLFNVDTMQVTLVLPVASHLFGKKSHGISITSVSFVLNSTAILCGLSNGTIALIDHVKKELFKFQSSHTCAITQLEISSLDDSLALVCDEGSQFSVLQINNTRLRTGETTFQCKTICFHTAPGGESCIHFSPVEKDIILSVPMHDHAMFLFDYVHKHVFARVNLPIDIIQFSISSNGKYLTALSNDSIVTTMTMEVKKNQLAKHDHEFVISDRRTDIHSMGSILMESVQYSSLAGESIIAVVGRDSFDLTRMNSAF